MGQAQLSCPLRSLADDPPSSLLLLLREKFPLCPGHSGGMCRGTAPLSLAGSRASEPPTLPWNQVQNLNYGGQPERVTGLGKETNAWGETPDPQD